MEGHRLRVNLTRLHGVFAPKVTQAPRSLPLHSQARYGQLHTAQADPENCPFYLFLGGANGPLL
jgi:hypothetical protein